MLILAIDPGTTESAFALQDFYGGKPRLLWFAKMGNAEGLAEAIKAGNPQGGRNSASFVVEEIVSYGQRIGKETLKTSWWSGVFYATIAGQGFDVQMMPRVDVKHAMCGHGGAKDPDLADAVVGAYGHATMSGAKGRKKSPGPLYGVKDDVWQALALGLAAYKKMEAGNV